jgi:hypothetical protein
VKSAQLIGIASPSHQEDALAWSNGGKFEASRFSPAFLRDGAKSAAH